MTTEVQNAINTINTVVDPHLQEILIPKILHKKCMGEIRAVNTEFSVRYRCLNPKCKSYMKLFPLKELLVQYKPSSTEEKIQKKESNSVIPKKEELKISIHFSSGKSMELDTFFYRFFIYRIFKCFYCCNLKIFWKKGIVESHCRKDECNFREMWEI